MQRNLMVMVDMDNESGKKRKIILSPFLSLSLSPAHSVGLLLYLLQLSELPQAITKSNLQHYTTSQ